MADTQITIDSIAVANGTWRYINGQFGLSKSSEGLVVLEFECVVEGSTASEAQQRASETIAAFTKQNVTCKVTLDSTDSSNILLDVTPNNGTYRSSVCRAALDPVSTLTEFSIPIRVAYTTVENVTFNGGGSGGGDGQTSQSQLTVGYDAGRIVTRTYLATYSSEAAYQAARADVLANIMLVGTSGAQGGADNLALTFESGGLQGSDYVVTLQSRYFDPAYNVTGMRSLTSRVDIGQVEEWSQENAGPVPSIARHSGSATFVLGTNLTAAWASLQAIIAAQVASLSGGAAYLLRPTVSYNQSLSSISWDMVYQVSNGQTLVWQQSYALKQIDDYAWFRDASGRSYLQRAPGDADEFATVVITTRGVGQRDRDTMISIGDSLLSAVAQDFVRVETQYNPSGPKVLGAFGSVYDITYQAVYRKVTGGTR